jgi:acyl carrier protein
MEIENQIQQYIAENLLFSDNFPYGADASFLGEGVLDSLGIMQLVTFVTTTFRVEVNPEDVSPDNFDSVNRLASFIRRRQVPAAPPVAAQPN